MVGSSTNFKLIADSLTTFILRSSTINFTFRFISDFESQDDNGPRLNNPIGDITEYWYDAFGNIRYKQHPDLGTISYAYDLLGNVRFVQTEQQMDDYVMTFNEYDDLNRLVIVGEARFDDPHTGIGVTGGDPPFYSVDHEKEGWASRVMSTPTDDSLVLSRITDYYDPNRLQDDSISAILTANKTLWITPIAYGNTVPSFTDYTEIDTVDRDCAEMATAAPGAVGPFLRHKALTYEPDLTYSEGDDFENLAKRPYNARIGISYDRLPERAGAIWGHFPIESQWDDLAPHGVVRNLKGREAAVAYREHGGEPFHYSVISYDERGRPEALIHYNENLGFDAVYYRYNSMNQVVAISTSDPLRTHTTWYGYDDNGRVDSVWSRLDTLGSGLWRLASGVWVYPYYPMERPLEVADITYAYTPTGQVDSMRYPTIDVTTDYDYTSRKWLDSMVVTDALGSVLFRQDLIHEATGQITGQHSQHAGSAMRIEGYFYDALGQLTDWNPDVTDLNSTVEEYSYDAVGNRTSLLYNTNAITPHADLRYGYGRATTPLDGPNRLLVSRLWPDSSTMAERTEYAYDPDGSMITRSSYDAFNTLLTTEEFDYSSWRGLSWKYRRTLSRSTKVLRESTEPVIDGI